MTIRRNGFGEMRVSSGVPGFDAVVDGGLPSNRLFILSGPPGSGKTTFSLQFAATGAQAGERGLYISMHETAGELARAFSGFDIDVEGLLSDEDFLFLNVFEDGAEGLLTEEQASDYRTNIRNQVRRIRTFVDDHNLDRLVVDSAMLLQYYFDDDRDTFITFLTGLKQVDATILLVSEMTDPTAYADDHYLAHGLIFLHNFLDRSGDMQRGVQVIKMRGTPIDTEIHGARFTDEGLTVAPDRTIDT